MRVPRTMGRPDTFPGITSISSQAVQSISEFVAALAIPFPLYFIVAFTTRLSGFREERIPLH
jgi:hypothetical protein